MRARAAVCVALALLVLATFWPVTSHQFVAYDDDEYVVKNPFIREGLGAHTVRWTFTTFRAANWHPLTWISHTLDVQLFGLDPGRHHLTSLAIHAANAVLLYLVLAGMTGAHGPAALTAALFAVHPLHVESVAWVSERKDVLSTLFWFLAFGAYLRSVRRPSRARSAATAGLFALALLAKPMPVTFPFVLLLLDWWPLGRVNPGTAPRAATRTALARLVAEKAPLFLLAAASSVVTVIAQQPPASYPFGARGASALLAYAAYLLKLVRPADLVFLYPLRTAWSAVQVAAAVALLAALSVAAGLSARRRPWVAVGWFWYLGTLVPVIGLVQVGLQAMGDRYTYVPAVGVFLVAAFGLRELAARHRGAAAPAAVAAAALVLGLAALARTQAGHWRDSESLFRHGVESSPGNLVALSNLGDELARQGRDREAEPLFRECIRRSPDFSPAHTGLGMLLSQRGDFEGALTSLEKASALDPASGAAHNGLGVALARLGRLDEAYPHFLKATRLEPEFSEAHCNTGRFHDLKGDHARAAASYRAALEIEPGLVPARNGLGSVLLKLGRPAEAAEQFRLALRSDPGNAQARFQLERLGSPGEARPAPRLSERSLGRGGALP
jgi:tetratricopeptide (TPR) repeat protein